MAGRSIGLQEDIEEHLGQAFEFEVMTVNAFCVNMSWTTLLWEVAL